MAPSTRPAASGSGAENVDSSVPEAVEYIRNLNVDDAAIGQGDPKIPSLLALPPELRHQIYSHFLKCPETEPIEGSETKSVFDFKVLSICQQMRDEVWEYFCSANHWIEYNHYPLTEQTKIPSLECTDPVAVPLNLFTNHELSALNSRLNLKIHAGKECGIAKLPTDTPAERKIFAYNRQTWVKVCVALAYYVRIYRYISIDLATRFHNDYEALFPDFLSYLSLIRGPGRVHFCGLMSNPLFKQMEFNMSRRLPSLQVMHEYFRGIREQGDFEMSRNDVESARQVYMLGLIWRHEVRACNMPLMPGVWQLYNELILISAKLTNDRIDQLKINGILPQETIHTIVWNWYFTESMSPWLVLPDEQRMQKHHEQGSVFWHLAEYIKIPGNMEYAKATFPDHRLFDIAQQENPYNLAAHQFMFAADLDTVDQGQSWKMWQDVNREFDAEASWKPEIHIMDVPTYGTWRGDKYWLDHYLMHPNRIQSWVPAAVCFKNEKDLKSQKDELGITWRDERPGLLRLMLAEAAG